MEAIILAGGLGTRLQAAVPNLPKPMAPIKGTPFMVCILNYLGGQNIDRVILATGYKREVIQTYFGNCHRQIQIDYSCEEELLGTGGALKKALQLVTQKTVFLVNGDTFFRVNLEEMQRYHIHSESKLTIALKKVTDSDRYGLVRLRGDCVLGFCEKKGKGAGFINGGIYCINSDLFDGITLPDKFSFEKDFLEKYCQSNAFRAFCSDGYFIDIGIPEDYARAQVELGIYLTDN